jgi:16S rRNA (guanine(966)-N(2))-methyltransferase RsmD
MRVIAGTRKGHLLQAPRGLWTRPTSDRARTILFDLLQSKVSGAFALDLFAGSGALGIEALSRGASQVDFVEKSRRVGEFIRRNLSHTHLGDHGQVIIADAFAFLNRAEAADGSPAYDLLFADPPYNLGHSERLLDVLSNSRLLNAGAVAVLEEVARKELKSAAGRLRCYLRRVIGETALHFYEVS